METLQHYNIITSIVAYKNIIIYLYNKIFTIFVNYLLHILFTTYYLFYLSHTSVNPVHNAPVEFPPGRSFLARAPPLPGPSPPVPPPPPPPGPSPPVPPLPRPCWPPQPRASPGSPFPHPPKHSIGNGQWLESSRHCPHRQTYIVTLIYRII
jgi:hypothetical protein